MLKLRTILLSFLFIGFAFYFTSCTGSDLFDEEVDPYPNKTITGKVTLQGETDYSNVYVWMDGINFGTLTNSKGEFTLKIPSSYKVSGIKTHTIYYFLSNFTLKKNTVSVKDGNFEFGIADINPKGELIKNVELSKVFDLELVEADYEYYKLQINFNEIGSVYIPISDSIGSGSRAIYIASDYRYSVTNATEFKINSKPSNWIYVSGSPTKPYILNFNVEPFLRDSLAYGSYKMMPFIYGNTDQIPVAMAKQMISDFNDLENFDNYYHRIKWVTFMWSGLKTVD